MFRCKVCAEKDARIKDLTSQVDLLRNLLSPAKSRDIPLIAIEADAVMSGRQEPLEPTSAQMREWEALTLERDRILTGNF